MIIKLSNFDDGIHYSELSSASDAIGLVDPFFGNVDLKYKLDKSLYQVVIYCTAFVNTKRACDRCNQIYERGLETEFQITCLHDNPIENSDDETIYLKPDDDKIDISKIVEDYIKINLPMKSVCDDDCKGLCSMCGTNLNKNSCDCIDEITNPVWEPLQKLKGKIK